jgi:transcriptional regulator with XRE-family HTH domain
MHLSDYMAIKNLSDQQVAEEIRRTRATVSRIRRRKVRPDWETIEAMKVWSEGAITADDFQQKEAAE